MFKLGDMDVFLLKSHLYTEPALLLPNMCTEYKGLEAGSFELASNAVYVKISKSRNVNVIIEIKHYF